MIFPLVKSSVYANRIVMVRVHTVLYKVLLKRCWASYHVFSLRQTGDYQCKSGLECHKRDYGDPIPSACCGSRSNSDDICAPPEPDFEKYWESTDFVGNYDHAKGALGLCEGDCDDDCDCEVGLVCWKRDYRDPLPPGTCRGIHACEMRLHVLSILCTSLTTYVRLLSLVSSCNFQRLLWF